METNHNNNGDKMHEGMIKQCGRPTQWVEGKTEAGMRRKMTREINRRTTDHRGTLHTGFRRFCNSFTMVEVCIIDNHRQRWDWEPAPVARDER
jgi:hypothetical protein